MFDALQRPCEVRRFVTGVVNQLVILRYDRVYRAFAFIAWLHNLHGRTPWGNTKPHEHVLKRIVKTIPEFVAERLHHDETFSIIPHREPQMVEFEIAKNIFYRIRHDNRSYRILDKDESRTVRYCRCSTAPTYAGATGTCSIFAIH